MATANTLMIERSGRCSRLATMSLFILEDGAAAARGKNPSLSG
jgi:hypothetical protein